ncbi:AAA family ATPase [Streptomyces sp. L2]|uniref:AAA family ATPase n=1 Tax=Streptomyces sp. L2 TaxID=2162665 RepID=UPI0013E93F1F|nr:AAA family ATPase [Streptomyces sp. L2]
MITPNILHYLAERGADDPGAADEIRRELSPDECAQFDQVLNVVQYLRVQERGPAFAVQSLADVAVEVAAAGDPQWLFRPVISAGDYGMLSAEKKAGKTWAVLDAAVSCASGGAWLGHYPTDTSGPVIIFYGEGGKRKLLRRIHAIGAAKGLSREQVNALPIFPEFSAPKLGNQGDLELIRQAITERKPALVIVDPLYLSASGATGSDLISMGALLNGVQKITQAAGTTLLISHHWNKTGSGKGHDRSSGAGPNEWGRFLISVAAVSKSTDPVTKETTAALKWSFAGDEVADEDVTFIRRVRADNPDDLSSAMHYSISVSETPSGSGPDDGLSPADRKILDALSADRAMSVKEIGDAVKEKNGHGLTRSTISEALNKMARRGVADAVGDTGPGQQKRWILLADNDAGQ